MDDATLRELLSSPLPPLRPRRLRPARRWWVLAAAACGVVGTVSAILLAGSSADDPAVSRDPPARSERDNPEPRRGAAAVFDTSVGRLVSFGGHIVTETSVLGVTGETWQLEPGEPAWWHLLVRDGPPGRVGHAMAFDSGSAVTVLFGGATATAMPCPGLRWCADDVLGDTWVFDAEAGVWEERTSERSPPARSGHAMAYDPASDRVILFGGYTIDEGGRRMALSDTWAYDADTDAWVDLGSDPAPAARAYHAMAFDGASGRIVLWGGAGSGVPSADLWGYDPEANAWTVLVADLGIGQRWMGTATFDADSARVVLMGGEGRLRGDDGSVQLVTAADIHLVDGSGRVERSPEHDTAMWQHAAGYDPADGRILVVAMGRVWRYDTGAEDWEEITEAVRSLAGRPYTP